MSDQKQTALSMLTQANSMTERIVESGELTPDILSEIAHMDLTAAERVDQAALMIENVKSQIAFWKGRREFYQKIERSLGKLEEALRDGVKIQMVEGGHTDIHGNDMRFKISELAPKLDYDESQIPDQYKTQVVEMVVDDLKLKAALIAGERVPGARLVPVFTLRAYPNRKKLSEAK